jgi:methionine-R-sulfoxide reductase
MNAAFFWHSASHCAASSWCMAIGRAALGGLFLAMVGCGLGLETAGSIDEGESGDLTTASASGRLVSAPATTNETVADEQEGESKPAGRAATKGRSAAEGKSPLPRKLSVSKDFNKLNDMERYVILRKGTERAFTGEYWDHKGKGTYICRRCNAALYKSDSKFDSGCGWPSFDDEVKGAVLRQPDADGFRIEIVCTNCGGHLGHVFLGERFTTKNTRHCVNSISIRFIADGEELPEKIVPDDMKEKEAAPREVKEGSREVKEGAGTTSEKASPGGDSKTTSGQ